jgi:hypothetical protein
MAKGQFGDLFSASSLGLNQDVVLHSADHGLTWSTYSTQLPAGTPWSVTASNEFPPSVYAISQTNKLTVSATGGPWSAAIIPPWPAGYQFVGANFGTEPGATVTVDWLTNDFYVSGVNANGTNGVVLKSPVASHGSSWVPLTGTQQSHTNVGTPGMLKQDEVLKSMNVDSSSRAAIVALSANVS